MSDLGESEELDSAYDESSSFLESEEEDDYDMSDDAFEASESPILYTHAAETSSGRPIDRMKYVTLNNEDIQREFEAKAMKLDQMLDIGWEKCLILILKFDNNEHRLLDQFMNSEREAFLRTNGLSLEPIGRARHIDIETDPRFLCSICYCGPDEDDPVAVFSLDGCGHKFCVDCYKQYIVQENSMGKVLIKCPFSDPVCKIYFTISELGELSDYIRQKEDTCSEDEKTRQTNFLTEEEVRNKYQVEPDSDDSLPNEEEERREEENAVFNYQKEMQRKEKDEKTLSINKTLLSKHLFNIAKFYTQSNSKKIKGCSSADCDGMVQCLGFESEDVVSVEEMTKKLIIPTVVCNHKHRFCYSCKGELDHAPCPCTLVSRWRKKCKDDSETYNWLSAHTKVCPKCNNSIEKNGGCNHMTCSSCRWEFCWVCMGDWKLHSNNYNCNLYEENPEGANETITMSKKLLEKYLFYFERFDNQRISHEQDRALLEKFEAKILLMQKSFGISYIDTMFYRECIDTLLMARQNLMWSYALLYYLSPSSGKSLLETALWTFSNAIEALSHLFENTKITDVMKAKPKFLGLRGQILILHPKLMDLSVDMILSKQYVFVDTTYW